jgi:hypothetical protein
MDYFLRALFVFGLLESLYAGVWLLVVAFRTGVGHGLLMFFVGWIYAIIFSILHWDVAKKPFITAIIGVAMILGSILTKVLLSPRDSFTDDPENTAGEAASSEFEQKMAMAIVARIKEHQKPGAPETPPFSTSSSATPGSSAGSAGTTPASQDLNAPPLKNSLLSLVNMIKPTTNAPTVLPPGTNDLDRARSLLRVGGTMETGGQLFATVNQQVVKRNDIIVVELNGKRYRFRVRHIDLKLNTVKFDPVEP